VPDELLAELNGGRDYEKITALLRLYRALDRFGTTFGLVVLAPDYEDDGYAVELHPGNYMAFFEPWDSGEYDTYSQPHVIDRCCGRTMWAGPKISACSASWRPAGCPTRMAGSTSQPSGRRSRRGCIWSPGSGKCCTCRGEGWAGRCGSTPRT
jgi:hypothetical protein